MPATLHHLDASGPSRASACESPEASLSPPSPPPGPMPRGHGSAIRASAHPRPGPPSEREGPAGREGPPHERERVDDRVELRPWDIS